MISATFEAFPSSYGGWSLPPRQESVNRESGIMIKWCQSLAWLFTLELSSTRHKSLSNTSLANKQFMECALHFYLFHINWRRIFKVWRGREISNYYLSITMGSIGWSEIKKRLRCKPIVNLLSESLHFFKEEREMWVRLNKLWLRALFRRICIELWGTVQELRHLSNNAKAFMRSAVNSIREALSTDFPVIALTQLDWHDLHSIPNSLELKNSKQHKKLCSAIVHDLSLQSFKYLYNLFLGCSLKPSDLLRRFVILTPIFNFISLLTSEKLLLADEASCTTRAVGFFVQTKLVQFMLISIRRSRFHRARRVPTNYANFASTKHAR